MSSDDDRLVRRATFDRVADAYERHRLVPPAAVFDDLVDRARLDVGSRLLEIGCGTGQATLPLAERGFTITAVELGASLAERARRNLAAFASVSVVTSSFEEWDPAGEQFDAVVSFNAFHWIDPDLRFLKSAAVLREGGALAVLGSSLVDHDGADPLWVELQEDYIAATGAPESRLHVDAVRDRSDEFVKGGWFRRPERRLYSWDAELDAEGYVALLGTLSSHGTLPDDTRKRLFDCIHRRISGSPGRTIRPTMLAVLYIARRA